MHSVAIAVSFSIAVRAAIEPSLGNLLRERRNLIGKNLDSILADLHPALDKNGIIGIQQLHRFSIDVGPGNDFDKPAFIYEIKTSVALVLFCIFQLDTFIHAVDFHMKSCSLLIELSNGPTAYLFYNI